MDLRDIQRLLSKEEPVLRAEIQALYKDLDAKLHLNGSALPVYFTMDDKELGAYVPENAEDEEQFRFSLVFIGYCMTGQISKADRINLYKHEYAHYMTRYVDIPKEYLWQPGVHGSAWKYCCSLIDAIPSEFFIEGESLKSVNYDEVLNRPKPVNYNIARQMDTYKNQKAIKDSQNAKVKYTVGEEVEHPKFGKGIIEEIEQKDTAVSLHIRFGDEIKVIDQQWLFRTRFKKR